MGCGRSTMGSDSPSRTSKDEEWNDGSDPQSSQKEPPNTPPSASNSANNLQAIPFNHGGALLAQAKISGSQLDFFKVLDEKIENGPDYESEGDEEDNSLPIKKSRLSMYLEQWNTIIRRTPVGCAPNSSTHQGPSSQNGGSDSVPLIRAPSNCSKKSETGKSAESECVSSSEEENDAPKEAVKEQYMFMGSLYTLTRFRSDGTYIPRVDISPAHRMNEGDEEKSVDSFDVSSTVLSVGSTTAGVIANDSSGKVSSQVFHIGKGNDSVSVKVNGTFHKSEDARTRKLERADTPYHHTISTKDHIPSRPASLVLRTVFPNKEET